MFNFFRKKSKPSETDKVTLNDLDFEEIVILDLYILKGNYDKVWGGQFKELTSFACMQIAEQRIMQGIGVKIDKIVTLSDSMEMTKDKIKVLVLKFVREAYVELDADQKSQMIPLFLSNDQENSESIYFLSPFAKELAEESFRSLLLNDGLNFLDIQRDYFATHPLGHLHDLAGELDKL